jgi:hypothetical protein
MAHTHMHIKFILYSSVYLCFSIHSWTSFTIQYFTLNYCIDIYIYIYIKKYEGVAHPRKELSTINVAFWDSLNQLISPLPAGFIGSFHKPELV